MNGPDHYRKAEQLLDLAKYSELGSDEERFQLAAAQVHATLALAAAVGTLDAQSGPLQGYSLARSDEDAAAWAVVAKESV